MREAERLRVKLSPYWNCHALPYAENTTAVTNMTADMLSDENKADTEALGLTSSADSLRQANEDFNIVYASRSSEKQQREASDNMKTVRPKVDDAYRELVKAVNALYTVNALVTKDATVEQTLGEAIDQVNALVLQLTETISLRALHLDRREEVEARERLRSVGLAQRDELADGSHAARGLDEDVVERYILKTYLLKKAFSCPDNGFAA